MKTLRWMTFFAAMATLSLFTGCDKDDDNNTTDSEEPVAAEIAGTYSGKAAVTASGMSMGENDAVASLAEETGSTYSLVLNDLVVNPPFPNSEMEIGDVTFENVSITDGEFVGEYNISVEVDLPQTLSDMVGGMEKMTLPVSLVSGNVADDNLQFKLSVTVPGVIPTPAGPQDMVVFVDFDGNK